MAEDNKTAVSSGKYGGARRSILRNLRNSMLAFGLIIGLIFPFFAYFVLKTDTALEPTFFLMCMLAGLVVGAFNFIIFSVIVSRELKRVQHGMNHVNESISALDVLEEGCENSCQLEVNSADIIGEITLSFNDMTNEIFNRLELEGKTRALNENLIKSVELVDVAATILKHMAEVMDARGGLLYGGSGGKMDLLANLGIDLSDDLPASIKEDLGPVNHALASGKIQAFSKSDGWDWFSQSTPFGKFKPGSILLIPMLVKQHPVGLVLLASGAKKMDREQENKMKALRDFAAPFLDNAMLHRRITELAAIDELTRILNRRFGMRRLQEEFTRATRHGTPLSVLMFDIDHFKDFNDTYGHNAGDAVLKVVASILNGNIRAEDMACRYGGEEFVVMLSGAGMNDGALSAERFRRIIETEVIQWGGSNLSVSVSIGVCTYPIVRASASEELITFADKALYAAKEAGRNRVMVNDGYRMIPFDELEISEQTGAKKTRK